MTIMACRHHCIQQRHRQIAILLCPNFKNIDCILQTVLKREHVDCLFSLFLFFFFIWLIEELLHLQLCVSPAPPGEPIDG